MDITYLLSEKRWLGREIIGMSREYTHDSSPSFLSVIPSVESSPSSTAIPSYLLGIYYLLSCGCRWRNGSPIFYQLLLCIPLRDWKELDGVEDNHMNHLPLLFLPSRNGYSPSLGTTVGMDRVSLSFHALSPCQWVPPSLDKRDHSHSLSESLEGLLEKIP